MSSVLGNTTFGPRRYSLCEKVVFTRAMNFAVSLMPGGYEELGFWPRTWILPDEMHEAGRAMYVLLSNALSLWSNGGIVWFCVLEVRHRLTTPGRARPRP